MRREPSVSEVIKGLQNMIHRKHWREVVFCGFGEPLERLDCILEVTPWVKRCSGSVVRIDTNGHGYLLNPGREVVRELKEAGVDMVSISLNAHNQETYQNVCRPEFENAYESVFEFVEKSKEEMDTEITTVAIPEVNIREVEETVRKIKVQFRRREYLPLFWQKKRDVTLSF